MTNTSTVKLKQVYTSTNIHQRQQFYTLLEKETEEKKHIDVTDYNMILKLFTL